MNQKTKVHASIFSGFGAADLAATWMGWDNAFWCEIEDFPRTVLSYWFPQSIGYGNIKETDFTRWRGKIDVLTGGFPCQPFSVAGQRRGADDNRYLWPEMLRAIREIQPTWIIGENVNGIISMVQPGNESAVESQTSLFEEDIKETILEQEYVVETVCRSLEREGYSVQPIIIPACGVEAPHIRYRVFFIAHRSDARIESVQREGKNGIYQSENIANSNCYDACGSRHGETKRQKREDKATEGQREWIRHDAERISEERNATDTQCNGSGQVQQKVQSKQSEWESIDGIGNEWNATYTDSEQLENTLQTWDRWTKLTNLYSKFRWRDFPTQSPVCRGNDGLPFDVVRLTVSLTTWCTGAIKGYGNAIVPQVMHEIFKSLEEIELLTQK